MSWRFGSWPFCFVTSQWAIWRNPIRLEYANLLRMLGRHAESEAEFSKVLEQDPLEPEALLNMAVFHGKRHEKEQAVSYLFKVKETAEHSPHTDHELFVDAAQQIMDGVIQMDSIELTAPMLFDVNPQMAMTTRFYRHLHNQLNSGFNDPFA